MSADKGLASGAMLENRYRILNLLGQGGMSRVYLADDLRLGVRVAVKENLQSTPEAHAQFEREAQMLARLLHPNLPRVTDHFTERKTERQYLVMDYIEGEDLDAMIKRVGALPEVTALNWIQQILGAVEYLHSQNPPIIHRDIKPANIKITPQGKAVLVDFGIAKVYELGKGTVLGARGVTAGYAPPEQYGLRTSERSDIYALGATLYTVLTAKIPPEATLRVSGDEQLIAPNNLVSNMVSVKTERVVLHAMELKTDKRFQSVAQLREALEGRIARLPVVSDRIKQFEPRASISSIWIVLIAIGIGVLCLTSVFMLFGGGGARLVALLATATPTPTMTSTSTLTPTPTFTQTPTLTPTLTRTPTMTPTSAFLFAEDFVDNRNSWPSSNTSFIQNKSYHILESDVGYNLSVWCNRCGSWSDMSYEAMVEKIDGPETWGYGILFRQTGSGNTRTNYLFLVNGDGSYTFQRRTSTGDYSTIIGWTSYSAINRGNSKNKLRVIARGSRFDFYVNDRFVSNAQDSSITQSGPIGFFVGTSGLHMRVEYARVW